jgi:hypothetical protein
MVRAGALFLFITALLSPQDKAEHEFRWSLGKDIAADYLLVEMKGGRPAPRKDRSFIIYGSELLPDGGSTLLVNSYPDLGPYFCFMLPKGKVKVGSKWNSTVTVFKDARTVLTPSHSYKELSFVGGSVFRKMEKAQERDCAVIESAFQYYEIKTDSKGQKKAAQQPMGTLRLTQWLTPGETELVRATWEIKGRTQEYRGIKQGEEPKGGTIDESHGIELKKDPIKMELREQAPAISDAVKKGVAAIRKLQEGNGSFVDRSGSFAREFPVGVTSLALMALLHSGVKADDPTLKSGFAFVRGQSFKKTYEVAAVLMLLETKYLPLGGVQDIADLTEEKAREAIQGSITKDDKALAEKATRWLIDHQTKAGTWGYPEGEEVYDHSNTQYALLALKSAARMGVRVPESAWRKAAAHWLDCQRIGGAKKIPLRIEGYEGQDSGVSETKADETFLPGPWGYLVEKPEGTEIFDQGYGSMTCAGLTSLLIAESELAAQKKLDDELRKQIDLAKKQGLAWLQDNYTIRGAPPMAGFWSQFHYYYLYSLERVGVLYGIRTLGGHDWYLEGAVLLCRTQREDGSWLSYDDIPVLDTSFALLFLKRATLRVSTGYTKVR